MKKEGILFQGLCIQEGQKQDFLEEEGCYYGKNISFQKTKIRYVDSTYFLLYGIGKNRRCRELVQEMEAGWRSYLQERARMSSYRGNRFWNSLSKEEQECAQAALGLLEDIRYGEQERAELAWIGFWYLIYKGFQEIYGFMKDGLVITFQTLCRLTKEKHQEPFYGISYLCIAFLFAEELGVEIKKNEPYSALYPCMQRCIKKWGSSR
nr:hypothetical protein [uncultured Blautia sp.]